MSAFFPMLDGWVWWIIAGVLLMLELTAPGVFFIWLAIPAAVVGLLDLLFHLSWQIELLVFAVLSLVSVYGGRRFLAARFVFESEKPSLNRRMLDYIGRSYILDQPITEGRGRLSIDGTQWDVAGEDAPKGARVKVTAVDGMKLTVVRA